MTTIYGYWAATYWAEDLWLDGFWQDRVEVFPLITLSQELQINPALTQKSAVNLALTQEGA